MWKTVWSLPICELRGGVGEGVNTKSACSHFVLFNSQPGTNRLSILSPCLEAFAPVLLPLQELARSQVVCPELVNPAQFTRRGSGPKRKLLTQPVGSVSQQWSDSRIEVLDERCFAQRVAALVIPCISVVLPDVVECLLLADGYFPAACETGVVLSVCYDLGVEVGPECGKGEHIRSSPTTAHTHTHTPAHLHDLFVLLDLVRLDVVPLDLVDVLASSHTGRVTLCRLPLCFGRVGSTKEGGNDALLGRTITRGRGCALLC